jgi:alkylation response protein AidB-like acyl-CoA dehydrogenase
MACVIEAAAAACWPGPLLSTATASAVASLADASAAPLMADLAAGATAIVVLPEHSDVRAVRDGNGWRLTGSSATALGIVAAQRILLAAHSDDGAERWFVLDARSQDSGCTIEQQRGTDLCTDVGVLNLVDHIVPAGSVLSGIATARARCIVVALAACAAAGTVRRCVDAAVDYIRTREQFGKPVGAFQALQHKAAVLLVNAELAAAAAWDAVRAVEVRCDRLHVGTRHALVLAPRHQPGRVARAHNAMEPRSRGAGPHAEALYRNQSGGCRIRIPGPGGGDTRPSTSATQREPHG